MFSKMWNMGFRWSDWGFNYPAPEDFMICCWQRGSNPKAAWLAYRIVLGLYFFATLVYAFVFGFINPLNYPNDGYKFFIFLTNWTYSVQTVLFCLAGILTILAFRKSRKQENEEETDQSKMPRSYKCYWVLYNTALPSSILITILFWTMVYDRDLYELNGVTILVHVFNSVFMLLDFALVAHPIRLSHWYCPAIYSLAYIIFSVIYELSGGTGQKGMIPIYLALDWVNNPQGTITLIATAFFSNIFVHGVFSFLSTLKLALRRRMLLK